MISILTCSFIIIVFGYLLFSKDGPEPENYRVLYPNGEISILMTYQNAASYAGIFNGKIIIDPPEKT